jgi:hypothetical protein
MGLGALEQHDYTCGDYCLLGYNAVWFGRYRLYRDIMFIEFCKYLKGVLKNQFKINNFVFLQ